MVNPLTNRRIKVGGDVYLKLLRQGVLSRPTDDVGADVKKRVESEDDIETLYKICSAAGRHCILGENTWPVLGDKRDSVEALRQCGKRFIRLLSSGSGFEYDPGKLEDVQLEHFEFGLRIGHADSRFSVSIHVPNDTYASIERALPATCSNPSVTADVPNDAMFSTLDTLDSWNELSSWRRYVTHDGYMFDLLFLIKLCTEQLNTEKNFNPYPRFPNNPFTRAGLTHDDLMGLQKAIQRNRIIVSAVLYEFLSNPGLWDGSRLDWMTACIDHFETRLRHVRQFSGLERNGELKLLCYWKPWNTVNVPTESSVARYLQTMRQSILTRLHHGPRYLTLPSTYYFSEDPGRKHDCECMGLPLSQD